MVARTGRGKSNSYVLLSIEGAFFGSTPLVSLFVLRECVTPLQTVLLGSAAVDYTLGNGTLYDTSMGVRFACSNVMEDSKIECALFFADVYGNEVSLQENPCMLVRYKHDPLSIVVYLCPGSQPMRQQ